MKLPRLLLRNTPHNGRDGPKWRASFLSIWRRGPLAPVRLFMFSCMGALVAQSNPQPSTLFKTIEAMDSKLFDAYNHCDLETLGGMVSEDLEFYHDQTGLSVGKDRFLAAIKQNICGKVERSLVPGSLEVYPLNGYGAVEIGVHRFRHPGHPEDGAGEAKFITVWQNRNGTWIVTRAISYDHPLPKK